MSALQNWISDRQENGDDGTGFNDYPTYWSDLAELTHAKQVEQFNFCTCEEQEFFPYDDCPRTEDYCDDCGTMAHLCICQPLCGDHLRKLDECGCRL